MNKTRQKYQSRFQKAARSLKKLSVLAILIGFAFIFLAAKQPAQAACGCCDCCVSVVIPHHEVTRQAVTDEHVHLRVDAFGVSAGILAFPARPNPPPNFWRLQHYEKWLLDVFFDDYIRPALMMMSEQLTSVMMEQMLITGTFFDAKKQLETQRLFQELEARTHRDYHPSFGMCEIGTSTRSLAAAEFNSDLSMMVLNKRFMDRQLGNGSSVGASGPGIDRISNDVAGLKSPHNRLGFFLNNTCDDNDLDKVLGRAATGMFLCENPPEANGWVNRDIDWNNTVMSPRTVNVEFDRPNTSDNRRVFEMANYLYGHTVFTRPEGEMLGYEQNQDNYLDSRAVIAKRSVAQNSFDSIIGLKSRGTHRDDPGARPISSEDTGEFMRFFLVELGFPEGDKNPYHRYMFHKNELKNEPPLDGQTVQISYYGQMEVLAKKIYQRPEFYTQLYDKPVNVKRKAAAMQAIKLMLDRDIFDSQLRAEAIMSMILELKVVEEQQNIENALGIMKEKF
ncbi:MAG: hypothetical protein H6867_02030 [Rhodospirillales bacterium]|nr:hypothetical protein [Rhodospirillales bacterium]MCB9996966.1 hypothetical protein [Rhodospirillales bacterium]